MDLTIFRNNVIKLKTENKLLGKHIAKGAGLTDPTITSFIHGGTPSVESVYKLSKYFGVSMQWLLFGGDDRGYHYTGDDERGFLEAYYFADELDRQTVDMLLSRYGVKED